jgi:GTP cyclohydrolase I
MSNNNGVKVSINNDHLCIKYLQCNSDFTHSMSLIFKGKFIHIKNKFKQHFMFLHLFRKTTFIM